MDLEDLPIPILLEILSRLSSSADLARCRLVSTHLRSLSYQVHSVSLICSHHRLLLSRTPSTTVTPFRSLVINLVSLVRDRHLQSLTLGFERPFGADGDWEVDERDDCNLTDVGFVGRWLPGVGGKLRSLVVVEFWPQSCWRRTEVLALVSSACENLLNLEVRNTWLSVEGLKPLPMLKRLTFEFIRLDDEDLNKVNECFPSLEVLNLIMVGGLKEPKINLPNLKICTWVVSKVPVSLTICAPSLIELKLKCVNPKILILKTPVLSSLDLTIEKHVEVVEVERFLGLKTLFIRASGIRKLMEVFIECTTVKFLVIEATICTDPVKTSENVSFEDLIRSFPEVSCLKLGPRTWSELGRSCVHGSLSFGCQWKCLKTLVVSLPQEDFNFAALPYILDTCALLHEVVMVFPSNTPNDAWNDYISTFAANYPKIKWKLVPGQK